jgi:TolB-like protein
MGPQNLKNIAETMRAWRLRINASASAALSIKPPVETIQALALPDKPSIAVLPFQNISGEPEQEYFADGMVEDIITALSRFKALFVIARNSSFTYKGRAVDVRQVGRELGVRYVLEGSVRKATSRVRITGQLDISVRYGRSAPTEGLSVELARDTFLVVTSPKLVGRLRKPLNPVDLARFPLIEAAWPARAIPRRQPGDNGRSRPESNISSFPIFRIW